MVSDVHATDELPDATILVQLTDLHLRDPADPDGREAIDNATRVARTVQAMDLRPAAVLLTGDLSDTGDPASYEALVEYVRTELEPLGCPVLAVPGNHDHRGTFRSVYLGDAAASDDDPCTQVLDLDGVRIVACDTYLAGRVEGRLGEDQLRWLDSVLAASQAPVVVAMHHPSVPRGVPRRTDHVLEDRRELREVLSGHDVAAVLCGHSHTATAAVVDGVLHAAAPATAYLYDPSRRGRSRAYAGAGFAICTVRDGTAIVNPHVLED